MTTLSAAGSSRHAWIAAVLAIVSAVPLPAKPSLTVRVPQDGTEIEGDAIRYAGSTDVEALVAVNGLETHVYPPTGSFVGLVPLVEGANRIEFVARDARGSTTITRTVHRKAPPTPPPPSPPRIVAPSIRPYGPLWLAAGDVLRVECLASPGHSAKWSADGIADDVPLVETPAGSGRYVGECVVPVATGVESAAVELRLGVGQEATRATARGKVTLLADPVSRVFEVSADGGTALYRSAAGRVRHGDVPAGTRLWVTGRADDRYRVRLAEGLSAWVKAAEVRALPVGTAVARDVLHTAEIVATTGETQVVLGLREPVPFVLEFDGSMDQVLVHLFGVEDNLWWARRPTADFGILRHIASRPGRDGETQVVLHAAPGQCWGAVAERTEQGVRIRLRHAPALVSEVGRPLTGLVVALDPGHGGRNTGAQSPSGAVERSVNLDYSQRLARALAARGAKSVLLRTSVEENLSLAERVARALEAGAHLLLSCHCNSVGLGSDPLGARGCSTYSNWPRSHELADAVYARLVADAGLAEFGRITPFDFTLTRTTAMPAVLIEAAFLSHPEDEIFLISEAGQERLAEAIAEGLVDFVSNELLPMNPPVGQ